MLPQAFATLAAFGADDEIVASKLVAMNTVGLGCSSCGDCCSAQRVQAGRHKFEMLGVDAAPNPAEMIQLLALGGMSRKIADEDRIEDSMDQLCLACPAKRECIALCIQRPSPQPAIR